MTRRLRPLSALTVLALIGAGCSNSPAETGDGGDEHLGNASKTVRFAACMRENGVPEFPDPSGSGDQELVAGMKSLDTSSAGWKRAMGACKDLRPAGLLGGRASSQEMRARLVFAQCMRDNGVKDFPDPSRTGPLVDTNRIPSAAGRGARSIPGFQAAMDSCRDVMADALAGQ